MGRVGSGAGAKLCCRHTVLQSSSQQRCRPGFRFHVAKNTMCIKIVTSWFGIHLLSHIVNSTTAHYKLQEAFVMHFRLPLLTWLTDSKKAEGHIFRVLTDHASASHFTECYKSCPCPCVFVCSRGFNMLYFYSWKLLSSQVLPQYKVLTLSHSPLPTTNQSHKSPAISFLNLSLCMAYIMRDDHSFSVPFLCNSCSVLFKCLIYCLLLSFIWQTVVTDNLTKQ